MTFKTPTGKYTDFSIKKVARSVWIFFKQYGTTGSSQPDRLTLANFN